MKSFLLQPPRLMASNKPNLINNVCRILLFVISFIFCFNSPLKSQLQVSSDGDVTMQNDLGVGNRTTTHWLYVSGGSMTGEPLSVIAGYVANGGFHLYTVGKGYFTQVVEGSDLNFKKNVIDLDGSEILTRLLNINGHKYEFKSVSELEPLYSNGILNSIDENDIIIPDLPEGQYFGLIAQEVEKEFPELVNTDPITKSMGINYSGMVPLLLEAIKEQQAIINSHEVRIGKLESKLEVISNDNELKSTFLYHAETDPTDDDILLNTILYQNSPNPFSEITTIRFVIPGEVDQAMLYIYNMQGVQIQSHQINDRGYSALEIHGAVLKPGMYLYTLIADGRAIDTKRMILTD